MKKLVIIMAALFFVSVSYAQGQSSENKTARKEQRKAVAEEQYKLTKAMLENKDFVLEANYLQGHYGTRVPVNSNINFIKVDSSTAVIQVGSDYGIGYNGVGGVTAKGQVTNWELKKNAKNDSYNLSMSVFTPIGIYDLHFQISSSGQTTARLTGMRRGSLTFDGELLPIEASGVYEGTSI